MLDILLQWLRTFPRWEGTLGLDYADGVPGNCGLYPKGITEISRREDVLGNSRVRYRCTCTLRRNAAAGEENARWLLDFQNWVAEQSRLGLAPQFGDEPGSERLRAYEGKLEKHAQTGSALYTVQLSAEYTKLYEVQ